MVELFSTGFPGQVAQAIKDYSTIILPALALVMITGLLVRLVLSSKGSRDRQTERGYFGRAADAAVRAFTTNWQLTLLATTAFVLSVAAGFRTWDGMQNFTGEPVVSLMITFGVQGLMLIIAWLIGESFASGMSNRSKTDRNRSTGEWIVGMVVGLLFGLGLLIAVGNLFGAFDVREASSGSLSLSKLADKVLYVGVGVLLIATLLLNNKSDVAQPYLQSARIIAKNAVLWVMFLSTMMTSVFFSFDSFFTAIFPKDERARAAEIRAVNQIGGVVADIGALTQRRQAEEADRLFQSDGWKAYEKSLLELSKQSQGADQLIEAYFVQKMEQQRRGIAEQQERIATSQAGQAGLVSKKGTLTDELARLKGERPSLAGDLAKVKSELEERARGIDAKRVEAMAEEKGAEGTLKVGKGQVYRQRVGELSQLQDAYKIQEERVRDAQKRLTVIDTRVAQIERELAAVDGDIAKLKGEAQTADQRIKVAEQSKTGDDAPKVDPARVRASFERARGEFRQDPTIERLNALTLQCTQLYGAMVATPATKDKVRDIDCDPKPAAEAAGRVFALNAGLDTFGKNCAGGGKLPQSGGTDALLNFGRKCLQDSGLPSKDSGEMAARMSSIDLNRDDKAHRFVVTWNAFLDGNRLAYLALAIAIGVDTLVFMAGLFGANAVRSPLTEITDRGEMTADQLDATINGALKQSANPRALLNAVLSVLRPIRASDGFTSEIWVDPNDPLRDELGQLLNVASTIGAVRAVGADRYQLHLGFVRYLSIALGKVPKYSDQDTARRELVNVVGVALLPDPQGNAEIVLAELHPISDAPGFAAEAYPFRIEEKARQRLVLNTLGAGATVRGAVERQAKDGGRYFVSTDFYKTLLMMRAAAIPAFRNDQLNPRITGPQHDDRSRPLHAEPTAGLPHRPAGREPLPRIASEPAPQAPPQQPPVVPQIPVQGSGANVPPPAPHQPQARDPRDVRPAARPSGSELESSLGNSIRNELIQLGGLFPWDTRDIAIARMIGRNSEPEKALRRLAQRAPKLARLVGDAIDDYRGSVRAAYEELAAHQGHDGVYLQVLETVSTELEELMPLLMLSPGGPYQQILERLVYDLEPQFAEGALSPADRRIFEGARAQIDGLKSLTDHRPDRLTLIARLIEHYDERIAGQSSQAGAGPDEKRTLN